MRAAIVIVSADAALRRALVSRLEPALDLAIEVRPEPRSGRPLSASDIVVIPSAELTPGRCRELAAEGPEIVILAAFPRQIDQSSYTAAGAAAYVPMSVDAGPLIEAIRRLSTSMDGVGI